MNYQPGTDDVSESPDHSGFRDFSLDFNDDENILQEAFLSSLLWFTPYARGQTSPGGGRNNRWNP